MFAPFRAGAGQLIVQTIHVLQPGDVHDALVNHPTWILPVEVVGKVEIAERVDEEWKLNFVVSPVQLLQM